MREQTEEKEKKQIDLRLLDRMNKVPGGPILAALVLSLLINNLFPGFFRMGGLTTALFVEGSNCMMAIFLVCCGASLDIRQVGFPLYKGVVLTSLKFFVGLGIALLLKVFFGPAGFLGITPMIAIAALTNSNTSLYLILSDRYGDKSDTGAVSILSLNDGPFLTLVALGTAKLASINIVEIFAALFPLLIGMIWGGFDSQFREICKKTQTFVMFFMIFPMTAGTSFSSFLSSGLAGILLGIVSTLLGFVFFFFYNCFLPPKKRNAMGAAIGTTAGNAVMTPLAVAAADPGFRSSVSTAASLIGAATLITFFCCPLVTDLCDRFMRRHKLGIYS